MKASTADQILQGERPKDEKKKEKKSGAQLFVRLSPPSVENVLFESQRNNNF